MSSAAGIRAGRAYVEISANDAKLISGLRKALADTVQIAPSFGAAFDKIQSLTATAVTVAAAAFVRSQIEAYSRIFDTAKLAERLGMKVEDLEVLEYAGKKAGVSTEELTTALDRVQKNLSMAGEEGGRARRAISDLGLSAREVEKAGAGKGFLMIADALSHVQNMADRARIAQDLFGRGSAGILNLVNNGADGIRREGEELKRLGGVYSEVDAQKVVQAQEEINKLKTELDAFSNQMAISLAPVVTVIVDKLKEIGPALVDAARDGGPAFEGLLTTVETIRKSLATVAGTYYGIRQFFVDDQIDELQKRYKTLKTEYNDDGGFISSATRANDNAILKEMGEIDAKIKQLTEDGARYKKMEEGLFASTEKDTIRDGISSAGKQLEIEAQKRQESEKKKQADNAAAATAQEAADNIAAAKKAGAEIEKKYNEESKEHAREMLEIAQQKAQIDKETENAVHRQLETDHAEQEAAAKAEEELHKQKLANEADQARAKMQSRIAEISAQLGESIGGFQAGQGRQISLSRDAIKGINVGGAATALQLQKEARDLLKDIADNTKKNKGVVIG